MKKLLALIAFGTMAFCGTTSATETPAQKLNTVLAKIVQEINANTSVIKLNSATFGPENDFENRKLDFSVSAGGQGFAWEKAGDGATNLVSSIKGETTFINDGLNAVSSGAISFELNTNTLAFIAWIGKQSESSMCEAEQYYNPTPSYVNYMAEVNGLLCEYMRFLKGEQLTSIAGFYEFTKLLKEQLSTIQQTYLNDSSSWYESEQNTYNDMGKVLKALDFQIANDEMNIIVNVAELNELDGTGSVKIDAVTVSFKPQSLMVKISGSYTSAREVYDTFKGEYLQFVTNLQAPEDSEEYKKAYGVISGILKGYISMTDELLKD